MMETHTTVTSIQDTLQETKQQNTIAFVPTMGNLHAGHMALITKAKNMADQVVVSIFVNPLQFGQNEDFSSYPRTVEHDKIKLLDAQVDYLFLPNEKEIYGQDLNQHTQVFVPALSDKLCGKSRPNHFAGVTTIVNKLFNIVQPNVAVFGEKDLQQLIIIQKMVSDLCLPIKITSIATCREVDGLALSSRNQYLAPEHRQIAPRLYQCLQTITNKIKNSDTDYQSLEKSASNELIELGFKVDYFTICNLKTLARAKTSDSDIAIMAAARLGKTRLIDNIKLTLNNRND